MKIRLFSLLALVLLSSGVPEIAQARFGNEGPQGSSRPEGVIAEIQISGGLQPIPITRGIQLLETGIVIEFQEVGLGSSRKTRKLTTLSNSKLLQVNRWIAEIRDVGLVDTQAGEPECMDIPGKVYRVFQRVGSEGIVIAASVGCHEHVLKDGQGGQLKRLLDSFLARTRRN